MPKKGRTLRKSSGKTQEKISKPKQKDMTTETSRRSSLRSSKPDLLYDFIDDSPKTSNIATKGNKKQNVKADQKQKGTKSKVKTAKEKTVPASKGIKKGEQVVTPKLDGGKKGRVQTGKVEDLKKHIVKKKITPLPPPNFDDVSPIPADSVRKRTRRSNKQLTESDTQQETSMKSNSKDKLPLGIPKLNLQDNDKTFDDSAIFMSPASNLRKRSLRNEKTSTPSIIPPKKLKTDKVLKPSTKINMVKNTSTPCESKPDKKTFTRLKVAEPECTPIQRSDTPTSDYASMDSIIVPSPSPVKPSRNKRASPAPAFSLEDNYDPEPLSLNRSINSNYSNQKSKKKPKTNTYNENKVDEWASKVNSELEDIENFELSIEG